ncbi:hypothetical protein PR048_033439 [Dryococelus australis]|uniref:Uncharacterized protein n=1 Tax=Dryococelus australis TaxID=614101 RepID=A0ABQ9G340_9NEOP|nr:hypothetical protein PR048_033439 [Dryococelus australis]
MPVNLYRGQNYETILRVTLTWQVFVISVNTNEEPTIQILRKTVGIKFSRVIFEGDLRNKWLGSWGKLLALRALAQSEVVHGDPLPEAEVVGPPGQPGVRRDPVAVVEEVVGIPVHLAALAHHERVPQAPLRYLVDLLLGLGPSSSFFTASSSLGDTSLLPRPKLNLCWDLFPSSTESSSSSSSSSSGLTRLPSPKLNRFPGRLASSDGRLPSPKAYRRPSALLPRPKEYMDPKEYSDCWPEDVLFPSPKLYGLVLLPNPNEYCLARLSMELESKSSRASSSSWIAFSSPSTRRVACLDRRSTPGSSSRARSCRRAGACTRRRSCRRACPGRSRRGACRTEARSRRRSRRPLAETSPGRTRLLPRRRAEESPARLLRTPLAGPRGSPPAERSCVYSFLAWRLQQRNTRRTSPRAFLHIDKYTQLLITYFRRSGGSPRRPLRSTALSGSIPTCESRVTRPGIEPSSPWWEVTVPITQPPWPQYSLQKRRGGTGDPRENSPTDGIVQPRIEPGSPWWEASVLIAQPSWLLKVRKRFVSSLQPVIHNVQCMTRVVYQPGIETGSPWWEASTVSLLASHQGYPGSIPDRVTPDFRMWEESCRTMPLVGGFFSGISRFPPPFSIPAPLHTHFNHPHRLSRPRIWSRVEIKGRWKRETPGKTRRLAASSGTIPKCENPGIDPGFPRWQASSLTIMPPLPQVACKRVVKIEAKSPVFLPLIRIYIFSGNLYLHFCQVTTPTARTKPDCDAPRVKRAGHKTQMNPGGGTCQGLRVGFHTRCLKAMPTVEVEIFLRVAPRSDWTSEANELRGGMFDVVLPWPGRGPPGVLNHLAVLFKVLGPRNTRAISNMHRRLSILVIFARPDHGQEAKHPPAALTNQHATPLVDKRPITNVAEYKNVSGVARTNRTKVSGNADPKTKSNLNLLVENVNMRAEPILVTSAAEYLRIRKRNNCIDGELHARVVSMASLDSKMAERRSPITTADLSLVRN